MKHVVKRLDDEGYPVTTVDVSERPDWADAFRVTRTPTLALVRNNEVLAYQPRPMRAEELRNWFRTIQYTPNPKASTNDSVDNTRIRPSQIKVSLPNAKVNRGTPASFTSATMHKGTRTPANGMEKRSLDATVRLQVEDPGGISFATGTIVHTHQGESLVLTCGHVFRESKGKGLITAELGFGRGNVVEVPDNCSISISDANDIALVAIKNGSHPVTAVQIADSNSSVERGDEVFSLGCDNGDAPTVRNSAIKNLARYDGSLKYDIFGRPVNGRSGGGLFNLKGQLIGVCNAAAVEVDEGIYTALETVHWQLAKANLDHLFRLIRLNDSFQMLPPPAAAIARNTNAANPRRMVPISRKGIDVASNSFPRQRAWDDRRTSPLTKSVLSNPSLLPIRKSSSRFVPSQTLVTLERLKFPIRHQSCSTTSME